MMHGLRSFSTTLHVWWSRVDSLAGINITEHSSEIVVPVPCEMCFVELRWLLHWAMFASLISTP